MLHYTLFSGFSSNISHWKIFEQVIFDKSSNHFTYSDRVHQVEYIDIKNSITVVIRRNES